MSKCISVVVSLASLTAVLFAVGCARGTTSLQSAPSMITNSQQSQPSMVAAKAGLVDVQSMSASSPPKHVLTAAYLGQYGAVGPWSNYATSLNWAETDALDSPGIAAVGIKTMDYENANRDGLSSPMYNQLVAGDFAHDCGGHRIYNTSGPLNYLTQPNSSHLASVFQTQLEMEWDYSLGTFSAVFADAAAPADNGMNSTPCGFDLSTWISWEKALLLASGEPIIYNGLVPFGPGYTVSPYIALNSVAIGAMAEGCYAQNSSNPNPLGVYWLAFENSEITMVQQHKLLFCYANDPSNASSALVSRMYAYASFLLTYDPATSILWEGYKTPSNYSVMPESQFVALTPRIPEPGDISGLAVGGVYVRQYAYCYYAGKSLGRCAVVVNPDAWSAHPFPYAYGAYTHTLVLSGSGIVDGGSASTNGPRPAASVPARGAVIAIQ